MKKTTASLLLFLFTFSFCFAQDKFEEGSIAYDISIGGDNFPQEVKMMFDGAEMVTYIKGDYRRTDMNVAMQSTTTIINVKEETYTTLMDIMGMKYLIKSSKEEVEKETKDMPDVDIEYLDETKEIAGMKCKKAKVKMKTKSGSEETLDIFYTDEIASIDIKNNFKGLKGFPLEYSINQSGMKMKFSARKISKGGIADSKFELPKDGYKEMTMEQFTKEMMKFGG